MSWRLAVGLLLVLVMRAAAQSGGIVGRVHADSLNRPIGEALVALPGLGRETRTDTAGRYRFFGIPSGTHRVAVRRPGFTPINDSIHVLGDTVVFHFVLRTLVVELDSVTSMAARIASPTMQAFEQRRLTTMGTFVTTEQLRQANDKKLSEILRSIPGTRLVNYLGRNYLGSSRRSIGNVPAVQNDRRSPRGCWAQIILDGTPMYYDGYRGDAFDLATFEGRVFQGIEYYRSSAATPTQFNPLGGPCGTLVLWSRT